MNKVYNIHGHKVYFEQRTYSSILHQNKITYTWAYLRFYGAWIRIGDPWPDKYYPRKELIHAINLAIR